MLILLYTDQKQLEDILKLKAASKIWADIVNSAQASNGMFLYLDQSHEPKTGVVLNAKLELKAFIEESHRYIPVNQLSDKQKVDSQLLVKLAIKHLKTLKYFEDETSIKRSLQSSTSIISPSANRGLWTCKTVIGAPRPSSHETYTSPNLTESPNNLNSNMGQDTNRAPIVTPQPDKLKERVPFDNVNLFSTNDAEHNFGTFTADNSTEPGSSSQPVEYRIDTVEIMNTCGTYFSQRREQMEDLQLLQKCGINFFTNQWHPNSVISDLDVVTMATQTVSITIGPRWRKVSELLRRNSIRERFGIQAHKRQRCS